MCSFHVLTHTWFLVSYVASCLSRGVLFKPLRRCLVEATKPLSHCIYWLRMFVARSRYAYLLRMCCVLSLCVLVVYVLVTYIRRFSLHVLVACHTWRLV